MNAPELNVKTLKAKIREKYSWKRRFHVPIKTAHPLENQSKSSSSLVSRWLRRQRRVWDVVCIVCCPSLGACLLPPRLPSRLRRRLMTWAYYAFLFSPVSSEYRPSWDKDGGPRRCSTGTAFAGKTSLPGYIPSGNNYGRVDGRFVRGQKEKEGRGWALWTKRRKEWVVFVKVPVTDYRCEWVSKKKVRVRTGQYQKRIEGSTT